MNDPDATIVRPPQRVEDDPDATVIRPIRRPPTDGLPPWALRPAPPAAGPSVPADPKRPPHAGAAATAPDADSTIVRAVDARRVKQPDADLTVVRAPRAAAIEPDPADVTFVKTVRMGADDPDATVVRTLVRGAAGEDRTVMREATVAGLPRKTPLALPEDFRLHEYRIEGVLGQGGFGITYLATDVHLDSKVAIKEYLPEEIAYRMGDRSVSPNATRHRDRYRQGLENFLAEARTLATFRHPNIVRVARFFEAHRTAYMVLEYERGEPLKHWWPSQRKLGERGLVERIEPLLDGLSVVHAAGFLHRDIKPDNVQVRDADGRFVLLDFGSASRDMALADGDAVVVTPGYSPIEQYGQGEQGAWTDIYALGATLYWAIAGTKPPDAEARAAGQPMTPAREAGRGRFGAAFLDAVDWALQLDPAARPRSIAQWREKLLADHTASLGLSEALRRGDDSAEGDRTMSAGRRLGVRLRQGLSQLLSPRAWPLAAKLTVAMLVTALAPMLVTSVYNLHGAADALRDTQLRKMETLAHASAGRVSQLLRDTANLARALGTDSDFAVGLADTEGLVRPALQEKVVTLAKTNPDIQLVMLMAPDGTTLVSNDKATVGKNFRFREYFRSAMAGKPYTSGIVVGSVAGAAGVFFSEPVRNPAGDVLGVVVLRLHAGAVTGILDEARRDTQLTPFMIDGDGVVVHHPRKEMLFRSLAPLSTEALERIKADQRFRRNTIDSLNLPDLAGTMVGARQVGHVMFNAYETGVGQVGGYAPVPGHDWVVGVYESQASFEAPLDRLYIHLGWSVGLVGLLFAWLALRVAHGIVRPIRALTAGADALKSGDFDRAQVDVTSRDEVGQLARTFNVMVDVLRQRERERERSVSRTVG